MTDGRFESTIDLRPSEFTNRPFWAVAHNKDCQDDHKYRESCPYHDLRADGCFQPETWGTGDAGGKVSAEKLVQRTGMKGFHFGGSQSIRHGCGGLLIPTDTVPGDKANIMCKRSGKPWTRTATGGSFSQPTYQSCPPVEPEKPTYHKPFNLGRLTTPMSSYPHLPDRTKAVPPRPLFRLKAGKVPDKLDPRRRFLPASAPVDQKLKKKKIETKRPVFTPYRNLQGTFGAFPEYVPSPFADDPLSRGSDDLGGRKLKKRPIFTWHTHTKRTMPVNVPWTTGVQSAEAQA